MRMKQSQQKKPTFSYGRYLGASQEEKERIRLSQQKSKDLVALADDVTGRLNLAKQSVVDYTLCAKQDLKKIVLKELNIPSWDIIRQSGQSILDYATLNKASLKKTSEIMGRLGLAGLFNRRENNEVIIARINSITETLIGFNSSVDNFVQEVSSLTIADMSLLTSTAINKVEAVISNLLDTKKQNKIHLSDDNKIKLNQAYSAVKEVLAKESLADNVAKDFNKIIKSAKKEFLSTLNGINTRNLLGLDGKNSKPKIFSWSVKFTEACKSIDTAVIEESLADKPTEMNMDVDLITRTIRTQSLDDTQVERLIQLIKQLNLNLFASKVEYRLMCKMPCASETDKEICLTKISHILSYLEQTEANYTRLALGIKLTQRNGDFFDDHNGYASELRAKKNAIINSMPVNPSVDTEITKESQANQATSLEQSDADLITLSNLDRDSVNPISPKSKSWNVFKYSLIIFFLISTPIAVFTNLFVGLNTFDLLVTLLGIYSASLAISFWMGGDSNG